MRERSYLLSLLVIVVTTLLGCYFSQSPIPILTSAVVFIFSLRMGFTTGEQNLFKSVMETFRDKGYIIYVSDEDGEIMIERRYGDHWYKNK
tara:strand:- start:89 stop:361 length:273 start_codon:yes stop_codon:yes gene_type:complete